MTGPIDTMLLALIALGLLVLVVMVIYLMDKVGDLEKKALAGQEKAAARDPGPFGGLSGKKLWDALSGKAPDALDEATLGEVRERYATVLSKHIEALFNEGVSDARMGIAATPKNTRMISTLRHSVESWLPASQVSAIYQCGQDLAQKPAEGLAELGQKLDEACGVLYQMVQLPMLQAPSASLIKSEGAAAVGAAAGATPPAPAAAAAPALAGGAPGAQAAAAGQPPAA